MFWGRPALTGKAVSHASQAILHYVTVGAYHEHVLNYTSAGFLYEAATDVGAYTSSRSGRNLVVNANDVNVIPLA